MPGSSKTDALSTASPDALFISYNHKDRETVEALCLELRNSGVSYFRDSESLIAGVPWPKALEEALTAARAVVVILGRYGLGGWQRREMFFALDRQIAAEKENRKYPVIPLLLDGADPAPSFLMLNHAIDASNGLAVQALLRNLGSPEAGVAEVAYISGLRPYMGLHAFREEDSAFFFGRKRFSQQLFDRLEHHAVVPVIGSSGTGKSSVVFGGLLPMLRKERPPRRTWEICSFKPGAHPWRNFADALIPFLEPKVGEVERGWLAGKLEQDLSRGTSAVVSGAQRALRVSGGASRLIVVVDQFEELFTSTPSEVCAPFIDTLLQAANQAPLSIVLTLRGDFYGKALETSRMLSDILAIASVNIGPLDEQELREIVDGPASRCGAHFEPALVDHIVSQVAPYPGSLPLLEYALSETWHLAADRARIQQKPVEITLIDWHNSGEMTGAIATRANTVYESLAAEQKPAARRLFGRLVNMVNQGVDAADTRRRAARSECGEVEWVVAEKFASGDYRLLTISRPPGATDSFVEVTHEALLTNWKMLREWLQDDRVSIAEEQHLANAKKTWEASGRDPADLIDGAQLSVAIGWARKNWPSANPSLAEFLIRSIVRGGLPLQEWMPLYVKSGDAMEIARPYLESTDRTLRLRGVDIARWIPDSAPSLNALLDLSIEDESIQVRRRAVEALCGMGAVPKLKEEIQSTKGLRRRGSIRALAHARNVRGVGKGSLFGLNKFDWVEVAALAILDLIAVHSSAFALTFALCSLFFSLGWDIASRLTLLDQVFLPAELSQIVGGFGEFSFVLALSVGLGTLLRAIIDGRILTIGYLYRFGMLAGLVSQLIYIVGRLLNELLEFSLGRRSGVNLIFAFTDQIPIVLAMGVVSVAILPASTAPPQTLFLKRFIWASFSASLVSLIVSRLVLPLAMNVAGLNYQWGDPEGLVVGMLHGLVIGTAAGVAGFVGFRAALRVAFDAKSFPDWPVSEAL